LNAIGAIFFRMPMILVEELPANQAGISGVGKPISL
jgi:hypothetical protein